MVAMHKPKGQSIGERIDQVIRTAGTNPHRASIELGIARSTLLKWISGSSVPDVKNLSAFAEKFRVSPEWLMTGRGARESTATKEASSKELERIQEVVEQYLASALADEISPRVAQTLRNNPFTSLGIDAVSMTILDVHRVRDLVEMVQKRDHREKDGSSR
jgi:transcriptional regulator with XRE-family HTH domain